MRVHKSLDYANLGAIVCLAAIVLSATISMIACDVEVHGGGRCTYSDGHFEGEAWVSVGISFKEFDTDTVWPEIAVMIPNYWNPDSVGFVSWDTLGNPLALGGKEVVWVASALAAENAEAYMPSGPDLQWVGFETDTFFTAADVGDSVLLQQFCAVDQVEPPLPDSIYFWYGERENSFKGITAMDTFGCRAIIPTLTEWGMIIFGVVLLGFITWVFLKRRKAVAVSL